MAKPVVRYIKNKIDPNLLITLLMKMAIMILQGTLYGVKYFAIKQNHDLTTFFLFCIDGFITFLIFLFFNVVIEWAKPVVRYIKNKIDPNLLITFLMKMAIMILQGTLYGVKYFATKQNHDLTTLFSFALMEILRKYS